MIFNHSNTELWSMRLEAPPHQLNGFGMTLQQPSSASNNCLYPSIIPLNAQPLPYRLDGIRVI